MNTVKIFKNFIYGKLVNWDRGRQQHESWGSITKHYLKLALMFPGKFIRTSTLRHSEVLGYFLIVAVLYIILVFTDITVTAVFLIQNFSYSGSLPQIIVFLTIYPLAGVLSPLSGLLSVRLTLFLSSSCCCASPSSIEALLT
jgi:hypothetical protein